MRVRPVQDDTYVDVSIRAGSVRERERERDMLEDVVYTGERVTQCTEADYAYRSVVMATTHSRLSRARCHFCRRNPTEPSHSTLYYLYLKES